MSAQLSHPASLLAAFFCASLAIGLGATACGSDANDDGAGGASSSGASSGLGGLGDGDGGGGGASSGNGSSGTSGGDGGTCARGSGQTALEPLDMFIVFDRSRSMSYDSTDKLLSVNEADCDTTQSPPKDSRWCKSVVALSAYLKSTGAAKNRAALQFFGPTNGACDGTALAQSAQPGGTAGYTELPSSAFDDDLNGAAPDQGTPLEGAIRGLIGFTARPENRAAGRKTINVLITDADTDTLVCSKDIVSMSNLLKAHFDATQVPTYVIGMSGADFGVLETLAAGGQGSLHNDTIGTVTDACGNGAGPCQSWNVGNGDGNVLGEAMKLIQQTAIGCSLRMPKPETGTLDLNQVTVEYSAGGIAPATVLTRVPSAGLCTAQGFYYDNNDNPTNIELCPDICRVVSADPAPKVEVVASCIAGTGGTSSSGGIILK